MQAGDASAADAPDPPQIVCKQFSNAVQLACGRNTAARRGEGCGHAQHGSEKPRALLVLSPVGPPLYRREAEGTDCVLTLPREDHNAPLSAGPAPAVLGVRCTCNVSAEYCLLPHRTGSCTLHFTTERPIFKKILWC